MVLCRDSCQPSSDTAPVAMCSIRLVSRVCAWLCADELNQSWSCIKSNLAWQISWAARPQDANSSEAEFRGTRVSTRPLGDSPLDRLFLLSVRYPLMTVIFIYDRRTFLPEPFRLQGPGPELTGNLHRKQKRRIVYDTTTCRCQEMLWFPTSIKLRQGRKHCSV